MTETSQSDSAALPTRPARRAATLRTILALMLREMSTTYGRSALGYLWAILEPVGGILLLTAVFSLAFRSPGIGTSFPLFYATGMLPFLAYLEISQKVSVALRFSKPLLFYPGVTFVDALLARFLVGLITQAMIAAVIFPVILIYENIDVIIDVPGVANGFAMASALGLGVGTLNCFLLSRYPIWERTWAILNRPLFIVSCIFFTFESVPLPYRDWLWWNPLVHSSGQVRGGIYVTYDATFVSPLYIYGLSVVTFALGLLLLRRYHREIVND